MRSIFLILVLANLLLAAAQFGILGLLLPSRHERVEQISPEKLRVVRDAARPGVTAPARRP